MTDVHNVEIKVADGQHLFKCPACGVLCAAPTATVTKEPLAAALTIIEQRQTEAKDLAHRIREFMYNGSSHA